MDTNTKSIAALEQDVLAAARALGEQQIEEIRHARKQKLAEDRKAESERLLAQAELELASADAAYSALKVQHLTLTSRTKREGDAHQLYVEAHRLCTTLRERLWTMASSGDDQLILSTAREYGEQCRITWALGQANDQARQELERVTEEFRLAGEARKAAVQKRGRAKAGHEEAQAALAECFQSPLSHGGLGGFGRESALITAANALTGTLDQRYAYSYAYTRDLPIRLPEDGEAEQS